MKEGPEARPEAVLWAAVAVPYVRIALHPIWDFVKGRDHDSLSVAVTNSRLRGGWHLYAGTYCRRSGFNVTVRAGRVSLRCRDRTLFFGGKLEEDIAQAMPRRRGVMIHPGHMVRRLLLPLNVDS